MRKHLFRSGRGDLVTRLLLVALLFRAYVPVGFMPSSGAPFQVEPCPAVAPMHMPMPAHHTHEHSGTHPHFEHCPFGSAPAAGPLTYVISFASPAPVVYQSVVALEPLYLGVRLRRAHQPRGPPSLA